MPKVIMHDSITLDGAYTGFSFSPELMAIHYQIAATFGDKVRLFGSNTALHSIELFGGFTDETATDFKRPEGREHLSYWAIPDSKGILEGKLHFFRRSEYCRDVVVLVTESTPRSYLSYLDDRNFEYHVLGKSRVDLKSAISWLHQTYNTPVITVDSGRSLTNALLNENLIDEVSVILVPMVLGGKSETLFSETAKPIQLELVTNKTFPDGYIWNLYKVRR